MGKSLVLALMRKGILDIPLMFLLNRLFPVYGIVAATPTADILCCATALVFFFRFIRFYGQESSEEKKEKEREEEKTAGEVLSAQPCTHRRGA